MRSDGLNRRSGKALPGCVVRQISRSFHRRLAPNAVCFRPVGGNFRLGREPSGGNVVFFGTSTGRLAPLRYKVDGIGLTRCRSRSFPKTNRCCPNAPYSWLACSCRMVSMTPSAASDSRRPFLHIKTMRGWPSDFRSECVFNLRHNCPLGRPARIPIPIPACTHAIVNPLLSVSTAMFADKRSR